MPVPTPLECSSPDCDYKTQAGCPNWELMVNLLNQHTQTVHGGGHSSAPQNSKLEKLPRPTFTLNMTESQWSFKKVMWDNYIKQSAVSESVKLMQLQAACDDDLRQRVFDTGTYSSLTTEAQFLAKMKELSVIVVHKSIHLMNLWKMRQESDEPIRAFAARATSTADMCNMIVKCTSATCEADVCYRDHVVHQILIHGMRDNDIRVRVLSRNTSGELTTLDKLIDYIAAEEAGNAEASDLISDSNLVGGIRRKSTYNQQKFQKQKCSHCGESSHGNGSPAERKKSCKAWGKVCDNCKRLHHLTSLCHKSKAKTSAIEETEVASGDLGCIKAAGFMSLEASHEEMEFLPSTPMDLPPIISHMKSSHGPVTTLPLPHYVHDRVRGWYQARPRNSPSISAQFSLDKRSYSELGLNIPRLKQSSHNPGKSAEKPSICDTGAQLTVVPYSLLESLKIRPETIFQVQTTINGASNVPIMVEGGILVKVTAYNPRTGVAKHSRQLAYVSKHVNVPYLSLSACIDLAMVPATFPEVGSADHDLSLIHI